MRQASLLSALTALLWLGHALAAPTFTPDLRHLDAVPVHALPAQRVSTLVTNALAKGSPLQFAVPVALPLSTSDGTWQLNEDGSRSWRTRVYSAGAQTLNFHFSQFRLPAGGALWLYAPDGRALAGPYTPTTDGQLWTAVVDGDTAIIEARVPDGTQDQVALQLAEANHGYRGFAKAGTGSYNSSGSCEIDVVCPAGQPYLTQARALARITIGGNTLCSGQLVNNVRQDNTPFFLTANHCGITSSNASSVVFYWNYQNSVCGGNGTEPSYQTQSGSTWVAGDTTSDFTLIKAAQKPDASFNLYLAGWNAGNSVPQSGGIVHHPQGDVTKVAIYNTPASSQDGAQLCDGQVSLANVCLGTTRTVNVWQVKYSQGITEPGSSGSALYDQNRLIVGQLSGGSSACSGSNGNGQPDIYGRTNAAWTAGPAANAQLKANLDPDNTGTLQLGGKDANSNTTAPSSTSGNSGAVNGGGGSSGGGALPPLTLAGLALLALRRRASARRASCA
ncbi:MAG: GlyGly-CTERM sorting domain-containing protein [Nevskiaceae bacterium]|nr:MAG: GlyGly-CTERM sorting domain-containing protein [Nevskiaceae bacterium]